HPSLQDLLQSGGKPFQVTAPDSYTVVTKLAAPHALTVAAVGALRIMPRHVLERRYRRGQFASAYGVDTPPESLVTSGPFRLKQYAAGEKVERDRKSTRLNSSHVAISYAVFCLKKKKKQQHRNMIIQ